MRVPSIEHWAKAAWALPVGILLRSASGQAAPPPTTLMGAASVDVGDGATVTGNIGARLAGTVHVGVGAHVSQEGRLFAPLVTLENGAVVGDVQTDSLSNLGATVGDVTPYQPPPDAPSFGVAFPGTDIVQVPEGEIRSLDPTRTYAYLGVADGGTLIVPEGTYQIGTVVLGQHASLLVAGQAYLFVAGTFTAGDDSAVLPLGKPIHMYLEVLGADSTLSSVSFGSRDLFTGRLIAPNGIVSFGERSLVVGSISGLRVAVGASSVVDSLLGPSCAGVNCGMGNVCVQGTCQCANDMCTSGTTCFADASGPNCIPNTMCAGTDSCGVRATGGGSVACNNAPQPQPLPGCGSYACNNGVSTYDPSCPLTGCFDGACVANPFGGGGGDTGNVLHCQQTSKAHEMGSSCLTAQGHPGTCQGVSTASESCISSLNVTTQAGSNARQASNAQETVLTPALLAAKNNGPGSVFFGQLGYVEVSGTVNAQPLYVEDVMIGGKRHNAFLVATSTNDVYLFDAAPPNKLLWSVRVGAELGDAPAPTGMPYVYNTASECDLMQQKDANGNVVNVPLDCSKADLTQPDLACCCSADPIHDPNCFGYDKAAKTFQGVGECPLTTSNQTEVGIMSTPVIDPVEGVIYLVARTGTWHLTPVAPCDLPNVQFAVHKLRLTTGAELVASTAPKTTCNGKSGVATTKTVPIHGRVLTGTCDGAPPGTCAVTPGADPFVPEIIYNRPGLLLAPNPHNAAGKVLYIAFGGTACDRWNDHGWVMAYEPETLTPMGILETTPGYPHQPPQGGPLGAYDGGGVWQSGRGVVANGNGDIFFYTGNGPDGVHGNAGGYSDKFGNTGCDHNYPGQAGHLDPNWPVASAPPSMDWSKQLGNSFVRARLGSNGGIDVLAQQVPNNSKSLRCDDVDLAAGGPVLVETPQGPRLVGGGKEGVVYVLDASGDGLAPLNTLDGFQAFANEWDLDGQAAPFVPYAVAVGRPEVANYEKVETGGPHMHGSLAYSSALGAFFGWPEKEFIRSFHFVDTNNADFEATGAIGGTAFSPPIGYLEFSTVTNGNQPVVDLCSYDQPDDCAYTKGEVINPQQPPPGVDFPSVLATESTDQVGACPSPNGMPGGFLWLSSNGPANGIAWGVVQHHDGASAGQFSELHAFDAQSLRHLWAGSYAPTAKYVPPVETNGIVFRVANRGLHQADGDGVLNSCSYAPDPEAKHPLPSRVYLYGRVVEQGQGQ